MIPVHLERVAQVVFVAGLAAAAAGVAFQPDRAWAGILMASFGLLAAGLGGIFFVALNYACGATWAVALRRIPEAFAAAIPAGAAGLLLVFLARPQVYPWIAEPGHLEGFKGAWLAPPFFFARSAVYVTLWTVFAALIVRTSRAQDRTGDPRLTRRNVRLSVGFLVVFGLTFWLASYDWIMSLEPHWYSTIFGVYNFAGLFSSALALIVLAAIWIAAHPEAGGFVTDSHLHDLGKLLFAFCTFWMYIWFSQYMLIWYANIPEEAAYYVQRREGAWLTLFYLNVALNWVVPFGALLSRPAKRGRILAVAAVTVLAGRWVDLYIMIRPAIVPGSASFGLPEIGPALAAAGLFFLAFSRTFESAPPVPLRDPALQASLSYQS